MHPDDHGVTELLRRASDGPTPDVNRLVNGGIARGRSRRRRARIGTAVASLAVIGVIGTLTAVVPQFGPDRTAGGIATDVGSATPTPETTSAAPVIFNVPATEFPATVGEILGLTNVTPALREPEHPDMVQDTEDIKNASFRVDGMLVRVMVFGGEVAKDTMVGAGEGDTRGDEYTKDGVMRRLASARRNGYVIAVVAYNAADDPDFGNSPVLAAEPVLSASQLTDIVTSDVWFEGRQ